MIVRLIRYSLNWKEPVSLMWYEKRGLDPEKDVCCCGRIDIRGLPYDEFYMGRHEYFVPTMKKSSWDKLDKFLEGLETSVLLEYDEIIMLFEKQNGKIEWVK